MLAFEELLVFLSELSNLGLDDHCAIALAGMVDKVLLVIVLGGVKGPEGFHLGDDGT
jgi:hypothetical protein